MKIKSFTAKNFTVFEDETIEFCEGINVFIGANATGKTHVLKAMYALLKNDSIELPSGNGEAFSEIRLQSFAFRDVFKPDLDSLTRLIRRTHELAEGSSLEDRKATLEVQGEENQKWQISIGRSRGAEGVASGAYPAEWTEKRLPTDSVFIPSREILSVYRGFAAAYEKRETPFDRTYYDLCRALAANPLRKLDDAEDKMVAYIEDKIDGKVFLKGDTFYIDQPQTGPVEAPLLPQGHCRLATLVYLIKNGALNRETILFWDEPEANLNPIMITQTVEVVKQLAKMGVQVFLATHDYLLSFELSAAAEYARAENPPMRFFGFAHENEKDRQSPVHVQAGDTLHDLPSNPILDEFAEHYDRKKEMEREFLKNREKSNA